MEGVREFFGKAVAMLRKSEDVGWVELVFRICWADVEGGRAG